MENILVTAIGSFSADIVIKDLKRHGYKVIGTDINQKELIVDAYNVDKFYRSPYASNENEYLRFLKEIITREKINYVIPLTDFEIDVINKHREKIENNDCIVCISDIDSINICRNKMKTYQKLKDNDISTCIPTFLLSLIDDFREFKYPLVLKPYDGRSSQGLIYAETYKDLVEKIEKIDISKYICQPKINGIVVTVDVIRDPHTNQTVSISRKEMLRTLNGAGTSVYIFKDLRLDVLVDEITNVLGVKGCVNFEFIYNENDDCYYFIECNPRFSGGVEFSCIAGYDMVINHLNIFKNKKIDKLYEIKNQYIARKYEEYVTFVNE
ncbi:ATP-grasp domain-containing protein [Thomasclavelia cocleata]|uniref:ATP-grasp domain-containing protein n=1 Tax=Thomasclavelia cocleata TaxID=69824 RepID=UPI002557EE6A|nr:ATP-grasp domain-containing protein [Thomasclavelia cocleata]